jgi:type II secretory pathway pseudopilin PulG
MPRRGAPPARRSARAPARGGFAESLAANRVLIAITFVALVVIGAIVALATDSWWAVVVAAVVHAAGTFIVLATLAGMTRQTEHLAPDVAAKLADEGVLDPDAELSRLVEEFSGEDSGEGSAEMVTSGRNEQRVHPQDSPAQAATEQRTANTPAGVPTQPAGTGSGIDRCARSSMTVTRRPAREAASWRSSPRPWSPWAPSCC